jgi:hypothetical protein
MMKCLLMALLLLPTISFADELHLDLDLSKIYRKSLGSSDGENERKHEEGEEAKQDRIIRELIREMNQPRNTFDSQSNSWWGYQHGLVVPGEKGDE